MASRSVSDLCEQTRAKIIQFEAELDKAGIKYKGLDTYRSFHEQAELYAQGRTKPGKIVTNARPGHSYHNVRRARDYALRDQDEDFDSDDLKWQNTAAAVPVWNKFGSIAESCGLRWGGRWRNPDRPHVEDGYCPSCRYTCFASEASHFDESGNCVLVR